METSRNRKLQALHMAQATMELKVRVRPQETGKPQEPVMPQYT